MKNLKEIFLPIAVFSTGVILSSLWITDSNTWKVFLPIALLSIILNFIINDEKNKEKL